MFESSGSAIERQLGLRQMVLAERLLLWGVRAAAQMPTLTGCRAPLLEVYERCGIGDAIRPIDALLAIAAATMPVRLALHGPACPCVSASEAALLAAVAATQVEAHEAARRTLACVVAGGDVPRALARASAIGHVFAAAGLAFPRGLTPDEAVGRNVASIAPATATLH